MSHDVELVVHCYRYARSLAYQMSGLILDPPKCEVQYTVYFTDSDSATQNTLRTLYPHLPVNVHLVPRCLDKSRLFRRAIGRNDACLQTLASGILILADSDYVYPGSVIDEILSNGLMDDAALTYPNHYHKQVDHATGDEYLQRQIEPQVLGLDSKDFQPCRLGKAIGGVMIYNAVVARKIGYLSGTRWMEPTKSPHFQSCRCDIHFRGWLCGKGYAIKDFDGGMPWRIRHSQRGRDGNIEVDN